MHWREKDIYFVLNVNGDSTFIRQIRCNFEAKVCNIKEISYTFIRCNRGGRLDVKIGK